MPLAICSLVSGPLVSSSNLAKELVLFSVILCAGELCKDAWGEVGSCDWLDKFLRILSSADRSPERGKNKSSARVFADVNRQCEHNTMEVQQLSTLRAYMGPQTRRAIRAYERDHNMRAYGAIRNRLKT